jgi:hypothetical protein
MNRPNVLVRLAGWPPLTVMIFGVSAVAVAEWYGGKLPWWFALLAAGVAAKTAGAFVKRRNYNAWAAQWDAMAGEQKSNAGRPAREKKKIRGQAYAVIAAVVLFVLIPRFFPRTDGPVDITRPEVAVWLLCGLYPVFALMRAMIRLVRRKAPRTEKGNAAPVSWMLRSTVDSPSREAAVRNLPEYAARILSRGGQPG